MFTEVRFVYPHLPRDRFRRMARRTEGSVAYAGKHFLVWRKIAGEWAIALYGVSSDQQTPSR